MTAVLPATTDCCDGSLGTAANFLVELLADGRRLTAVEKFSQWHENETEPVQAKHYRDLAPVSTPMQGEQYAFEVDLDACSGCKACVTACHNLNGLEEDELWRNVGMLHGGTSQAPVIQHVTTACHHCLEPACLEGCPVDAYEKDPVTGIVRHLDDQCIGCQYCMLKCPYDVPRYSRSKGIVRKCDMCSDRLAAGEAPACVQACPSQAIRIRIVNQQAIVEESEANQFLPGAPEPGYTLPTTIYKSQRPLPRNLLPADYFSARPGHSHLPLVFMLVLTQMSVGAFVVEGWLSSSWFAGDVLPAVRPLHLVAGLLLGLLGLGAAVFHLGRPRYAFRAILGIKRSWLSREMLAFGLFAATASVYVVIACLTYLGIAVPSMLENSVGVLAAGFGVAGIVCSVMIYVDTRRPFWNATQTSGKFFLTALVLGIPIALLISLASAAASDVLSTQQVMAAYGRSLCQLLMISAAAKLLFESSIFLHLRQRQYTPLKRTALLMTGELGMTTLKRFFFGGMGGIALPLLLLGENALAGDRGFEPLFVGCVTLLIFLLLAAGELLERYLFFTASVAPKMPGSLAP